MDRWTIALDIEMMQWNDLLDRIDNLIWIAILASRLDLPMRCIASYSAMLIYSGAM